MEKELERLHEENKELRKIIEGYKKYTAVPMLEAEAEQKENAGNILFELKMPAALYYCNELGSYINGKDSFEDLIGKELDKITMLKRNKSYVMNLEVNICLIDPEKKMMVKKAIGGKK